MRKVLFFPSFGGRGFGHVNRCLALAREFTYQKWETAFVIAGPQAIGVENEGHRIYRPLLMRYPSRKLTRQPAYTFIQNGNGQALRDGLWHSWRVWFSVLETMQFVKYFRPDILIGDSSLLPWIVGQRVNLPVVQIVQSIVHPKGPPIIWWRDPPPEIYPINIRPIFNPLLERWNLKPIDNISELIRGNMYLVPGIPATDPLPEGLNDTHYVGALLHKHISDSRLPPQFGNLQNQPILFVTMGGGGSHISSKFLNALKSAFANNSISVVIALGGKPFSINEKIIASNISSYSWLPGWEAIQKSSIVMFHGGHTTMMEVITAGVPALIIPTQSEQEGNGRRLEVCSAGIVLSPSEKENAKQLIHSKWSYGKFTTWIVPDYDIDPYILRETAIKLLKNTAYRESMGNIKSTELGYGGVLAAVELIKSLI